MFSSPSVIVLGAGASYEFGAPLGEDLWGQIVNSTATLQNAFEQYVDQTPLYTIQQFLQNCRFEDPKAYAYFAEIVAMYEEPGVLDEVSAVSNAPAQFRNNVRGVAARIAQRVKEANFHVSVDDFVRDNRSLLRPLQVLIAATIFHGLYDRDSNNARQWKLKELAYKPRFTNPHNGKIMVDNWYPRFIGACRPMLIGLESVTPVTVISFNYDRLMETVLCERQKAERKFPSFSECFNFIYPYGSFADFPSTVVEPGNWLRKQAVGIGLADGKKSAELRKVRAAIAGARQIFSIGFSFTETNMKLLGLRDKHGPRLFVQNYGNADTRLTRTLAKFPGARSDAGSIAQLIRDGFFEQTSPAPAAAKRVKTTFLKGLSQS